MKFRAYGTITLTAVLALAALNLYQRNEIADLTSQLEANRAALEISEMERQSLLKRAEDLGSELILAQNQASSLTDSDDPRGPVIAEPELLETTGSDRRMTRDMSALMENPTFNKIMVASQRATLEVLYEDLAEFLVLDEKEKKYFMDLLVSRQMVRVQGAMKMMNGGANQEEREAMQAEMEKSNEETREEMEYFLNNEEDFEEWRFYEKTIGERMALSGYKQALAKADLPLESGVERQLVEIMHDEKEKFDFSTDLHDQESTDMSPGRFSPDNIEAFEGDLEDLDTLIAERVLELLGSGQFEQFLASQEQMRSMQISQLRMASQMFSQREAPAGQ